MREQILGYHDNDWKVEGIFFDETNGVSETEQSTVLEMYTGYMELTRSLWNSESRYVEKVKGILWLLGFSSMYIFKCLQLWIYEYD